MKQISGIEVILEWVGVAVLIFMASLALSGCDDTDSHDTTIITVCEVCWPPGHCMREDHPQFDEWWNALDGDAQAEATWERCEDWEETNRPPRTPWLTNSDQK